MKMTLKVEVSGKEYIATQENYKDICKELTDLEFELLYDEDACNEAMNAGFAVRRLFNEEVA